MCHLFMCSHPDSIEAERARTATCARTGTVSTHCCNEPRVGARERLDPRGDQSARVERLGELHRVEGGALEQVVADHEEVERAEV